MFDLYEYVIKKRNIVLYSYINSNSSAATSSSFKQKKNLQKQALAISWKTDKTLLSNLVIYIF